MQLVEIKKLDLVANTASIAEGVGRDHNTIIKLVERNKRGLEEFGRVGFEIRTLDTKGGRQKQRVALLNEQQTTLLITYMRNNEVVRSFKKRLVAEFFTMRSALAKKKMDRNFARLEYKPMDAIKHEREAQGKQITPHHFSNEADLINRLALGMTAAKFRVHHEIGKKEPIRDYLTTEQIHCITELQRANTVSISMGWYFEQRKEVLSGMFERNYRQLLIEEQHHLAD
ncbi:Rha family transcriptional regulator [Salmonella enterica]|nr:Rha family transcriptional regulator [Salmonella enterica]EMD3788475.1 Rha family transcriptional regulator [Salmonella enterica]EMD4773875.1 Rha family transcriptional regulator [Salmonella enterica]EMD6063610.1 Rha family transcriptional regulator [Salmonella enterica]